MCLPTPGASSRFEDSKYFPDVQRLGSLEERGSSGARKGGRAGGVQNHWKEFGLPGHWKAVRFLSPTVATGSPRFKKAEFMSCFI